MDLMEHETSNTSEITIKLQKFQSPKNFRSSVGVAMGAQESVLMFAPRMDVSW